MKKAVTFVLLLTIFCVQAFIPISAETDKNALSLEEADKLLMAGCDLVYHIKNGGYVSYERDGYMFLPNYRHFIIRYNFLTDAYLKYSVYPNGKKAMFEGEDRIVNYHKVTYTTPDGDVLSTFTEFKKYTLTLFSSEYVDVENLYRSDPTDVNSYLLDIFGDEDDNILANNGSDGEPNGRRTWVKEIYSFKLLDENNAIAYVWYQYLEGYDEIGHLLEQRCLETVEFTNTEEGWQISGGTLFEVLQGLRKRSNYNPNTGDTASYTIPALTVAALISVALPVGIMRKRRRFA